ncbi:hypothetical protein HHK36_017823 [Tetracentron sinense]|uniref:Uncharacterized protein n=1 Tax=Tetracentron sinense TaxID=13715 RepID=A0A834YYU6_TETSI|nr:hypothetical protein HHK36_017823 [Tetracentron sinense]
MYTLRERRRGWAEKGYGYFRLEKLAYCWLGSMGDGINSQLVPDYKRADGHVQILQKSVHIPFLMGSLLFMVGEILYSREQIGLIHHGLGLLNISVPYIRPVPFDGSRMVGWLVTILIRLQGTMYTAHVGTLLISGCAQISVPHKQQRPEDDIFLSFGYEFGAVFDSLLCIILAGEELGLVWHICCKAGNRSDLSQEREGQVPLILEEQRRKRKQTEEAKPVAVPTPYKDVLVGQS